MNADLYINDKTFAYNGCDSIADIALKLAAFVELLTFVIPRKDDTFYLHESNFYETVLFDDGKCLSDILFIDEEIACYDGTLRDSIEVLRTIVSSCESTELSDSEIVALLNDDTKCTGLVVLNKQPNYPITNEKQILSDKKSWYEFHRNYLCKNPPATTDMFIDETKLYFENLVIHPDNVVSLRKVYRTHLKQIVSCLICLNDCILDEFRRKTEYENDFVGFLRYFKSQHSEIIEDASFEGSYKNENEKQKFTKKFTIDSEEQEVLCEPHLKMNKDDNGKIRKFCRIYFKSLKKDDKFVYVGIITDHIKK